MKLSAVLTGVVAAVAVAMPAVPNSSSSGALEARSSFNADPFNGLRFAQNDINYLQSINNFDLRAFQNLGLQNHLELGGFQSLFNANVFDIQQLLLLQHLNTIVQLSAFIPSFNTFNLAAAQLGVLQLGALGNIGGLGLGQFIDPNQLGVISNVVGGIGAPVII
ncbi:hypothetical protein CDD83_386 [Cordyceps sp. RAO-2017]|nr:hypothetical protein CDD83_386 [Cordyceps sp. RAO-2017]